MEGLERATSTRAQFFRAAGLLAIKHKGEQRAKLLKQFRDHWSQVYPDIPVPLDDAGLPIDFSDDFRFKLLADEANSPAASPHPNVELDKNDENPLNLVASLFTPPPPVSLDLPPVLEPQQPFASHSSTLNGDEMIEYLRQHHFGIVIRPAHSGIEGGLFPGHKPKTKALRVVFVENPDHRISASSHPLSFLTETSLDKWVYDRLREAMPGCVQKRSGKGKGKNKMVEGSGKIDCYISSWVSQNLNKRFLLYLTCSASLGRRDDGQTIAMEGNAHIVAKLPSGGDHSRRPDLGSADEGNRSHRRGTRF